MLNLIFVNYFHFRYNEECRNAAKAFMALGMEQVRAYFLP